jgi:FAD/FMN-containing dehydrogenase
MALYTGLAGQRIEDLQTGLRGTVIGPGNDDYDAARRVWNGMIDRHPALIVRCADTADVVRAVDFARANHLAVAVRGGGHNAAGLAVCDGGLVIDLSQLNEVQVDPIQLTARAQAGATWSDLDRATQAHGLATTGGGVSTTGIAGLTLGGGLGWLMRSHGLTCDNLISAEVVLADGRVVTASACENPDLFWGIRGGGGNFGIVTSFEYRLHPVGPVLAGMVVHPRARAAEVLRFYREFTRTAPDELTTYAVLLTTSEGIPAIALMLCYNGPIEQRMEVVRPLREFGPPIVDQVGPMPYTLLQSILDPAFPSGLQIYWRSDFLKGLADDAIDTIVNRANEAPSPLTVLLIEQLGGAVARVGRSETPFEHRDAPYNLAIISRWADPAQAEPNVAWTRDLWNALRPHANGVYVNYLGVGESADRVRAAYGSEKYERLVALKNSYDPTNFFRLNQNIKPSATQT